MTKLNYQRPEHILRDNRERELQLSISVVTRHACGENNTEADGPRMQLDAISADEMELLVPLVEALARLIEVQTSLIENLARGLTRANPLTRGKKFKRTTSKATLSDKERAYEKLQDTLADYSVVLISLGQSARSKAANRQRDNLFKVMWEHPYSPLADLIREPSPRMTERINYRLGGSRH